MAEPEPIRILDKLAEQADFHTAIFLTYGADLAFFEEAVLNPLWQNGCRNVLVFMDAERYGDTLRDLGASVTWVGRRYIVIPVDLGFHKSFHPKLALLVGSDRGRLLVGSGNLTFSGLGHNLEVYTCLDWAPEESGLQHVFVDSWGMVAQILEMWGHSAEATSILRKAASVAPWLGSQAEPGAGTRLLHTLESPLIDQVAAALAGETVERLTVLSPFLDNTATALAELSSRFQPSEIRLALQHDRTAGKVEALENLIGKGVPLAVHRLTDDERYSHAKIYVFETRERAYALTGSGNCTRAGLLSTSSEGNLEVMLLHRGLNRRHFAPLLEGYVSPHPIESLEEITIVEDPPSPPGADAAGIHLLDVSVAQGLLSIVFTLDPGREEATELHLQLSARPPLLVSLGEYAPGETHSCQSPVPQELHAALTRPLAARLLATNQHLHPSDLRSNEVWVTNVDVLRLEVIRLLPDDERAATYLRDVLVTSDDEWRELYECLRRLIALDVEDLKKRGGTYTASHSAKRDGSPRRDSSSDIDVTLVDDENEARQTDRLASDLFHESPLYAWLEHVRGQLPGTVSRLPHEDDEPTPASVPEGGAERSHTSRWTPSERLGRRFTNLVRKYIRSLDNVEYMEAASLYHILSYYSAFQQIAWLLLQHKVMDAPRFIEFVKAMNGGFFGRPEQDPPVLCPTLHRHIKRMHSVEWSRADVVSFALASVNLCQQEMRQIDDEASQREFAKQTTRTLAGIAVVTDISSLLRQAAEVLTRVGSTYGQQPGAFAHQVCGQIADHLPEVKDILEEWDRATTIALADAGAAVRNESLRQARLDYAVALYDVISLQGTIEEQSRACAKLVFWMRLAGYSRLAAEWCETLTDLLQPQGKGREAAEEMFHTGIHLLAGGEHEEAASIIQQASLLAKRVGDGQLHERCERFVDNIGQLFLQTFEDDGAEE